MTRTPTTHQAPANAGAHDFKGGDMSGESEPFNFDREVAKAAAEMREELEAARVEAMRERRNPWWKNFLKGTK